MEIILISIFVTGYLLITMEHSIKIDKLIPALVMMGILWAVIALNHLPVFDINLEELRLEPTHIDEILLHHLGKTAEILIFLLGAMTIVEIIDFFSGFSAMGLHIGTRAGSGADCGRCEHLPPRNGHSQPGFEQEQHGVFARGTGLGRCLFECGLGG